MMQVTVDAVSTNEEMKIAVHGRMQQIL